MRDDYRARSPRGRDRDPGLFRGSDDSGDQRDDGYRSRQGLPERLSLRADFPTGRRDYSRSPPRQDSYGDQREWNTRHFRDMDRARDYDGRYPGRDDGYMPRRDGDPRRSRHDARDDRHYQDMDSRDYQGPHGDGYPRDDGRRRPRYNARDDGDYQDMYDDGHRGDDGRRLRARAREWEDGPRGDDGRHGDGNGRDGLQPPPASRDRCPDSRSHSRTRDAGRPTDTVMLEGLPYDISARTLREGLLGSSIAAEFPPVDVRISSPKGHCRAFVQFRDVGDAISFVNEHFPKLLICLSHSTDDVPDGKIDVYIHYARNQGDWDAAHGPPAAPTADWLCPKCQFKNFASRSKCKMCNCLPSGITIKSKDGPTVQFGLHVPYSASCGLVGRTGVADVGRETIDKKVQILVVFPLPKDLDEDQLASEMKRLELVKSDKPKDEAPKLKSTAPSADGAGYGARPGSLHRVFLMREVATNDRLGYGFAEFWTLGDALAALKKYQMTRSFEIAGTQVTIASIHGGVFIPEDREVTPEVDFMSFHPLFNPSLRVRYRDLELYPSPRLVADKPPTEEDAAAKTKDDKTDSQKPKKRKADESLAEPAAKKAPAMAAQMAFWQRRHEEIRGGGGGGGGGSEGGPAPATRAAPIKFSLSGATPGATKPGAPVNQPRPPSAEPPSAPGVAQEPAVSFVDRERLFCLICMMKYKSVGDVDIHEKSTRHRQATEDEDKVKAALPRIAARDKRQKADAGLYRDRAKERREAHNQPNKPSKARPEAKQPAKDEGRKAGESKGAGMLAKMGWTAGAGLGAQGEGLTQALTASAYRDGVGLGAEGGKLGDAAELAESRTKDDYALFVATTQNKARERYSQME